MDSLPSPVFLTCLSFLDMCMYVCMCVCVCVLSLRFMLSVAKLCCSMPRSSVSSFR